MMRCCSTVRARRIHWLKTKLMRFGLLNVLGLFIVLIWFLSAIDFVVSLFRKADQLH